MLQLTYRKDLGRSRNLTFNLIYLYSTHVLNVYILLYQKQPDNEAQNILEVNKRDFKHHFCYTDICNSLPEKLNENMFIFCLDGKQLQRRHNMWVAWVMDTQALRHQGTKKMHLNHILCIH